MKEYKSGEEAVNIELHIPSAVDSTPTVFDTIAVKNTIERVSILPGDEDDRLRNGLTINFTPKVLVYVVFHSVFLSASIVAMLFMGFLIFRLITEFKIRIRFKENFLSIIGILILLIATVFLFKLINDSAPRLFGGAKIMETFGIVFNDPVAIVELISYVLMAVAIVALAGIAFINIVTAKLTNNLVRDENSFQVLISYLNTIALFSGLLVAGTVIGTSIQRTMIAEYLKNTNLIFPDEFIALYGVSFSFILAVFFLPTLFYIKSCQRSLDLVNAPDPEKLSWINIGKNTFEELKLLFSISLPILASIFEHFFQATNI
ncbi:MAG: hypothetical protein AAF433_10335 [Bacteroidota bacterium]